MGRPGMGWGDWPKVVELVKYGLRESKMASVDEKTALAVKKWPELIKKNI